MSIYPYPSKIIEQQAQADFVGARRKAFFAKFVSILRKRHNWLLSFDDVQKALPILSQQYKGLHYVPISAIVGSVDRYTDFDRQFLPARSHTRERWVSLAMANLADIVLPPVQLYKVGEVYFVKDGNHRVSVARQKGMDFIDAEVVELSTPVGLPSSTDPRDLIRLGEYARFLQQSRLDQLQPEVHIDFSSLGRYDVLMDHISTHRWYMGLARKRRVEWKEAVLDWYNNIYLPVVHTIRDNDILGGFPGKTEGDLYLWVMDHRWYLREETGQDVGARRAVLSYTARYGSWVGKVRRSLLGIWAAFRRDSDQPNIVRSSPLQGLRGPAPRCPSPRRVACSPEADRQHR